MPLQGKSFVNVSEITPGETFSLFKTAEKLMHSPPTHRVNKSVAMLFFEPSTRTRASFETAANLIGLSVLNLDPSKSSVVKGESVEDTLLNIQAMDVAAVVIRHSGSGLPDQLSKRIKNLPLINAGDGTHQHPTQALLDAFTIQKERGKIEGENVVIIGDLIHSRVARSNIELLQKLGANVAVCGPSTLVPDLFEQWGVQVFRDIDQAFKWCSVCMLLRMQLERQTSFFVPSLKEYHARFGLTPERGALLMPDAIVLHPGPVNHGVEISEKMLNDPKVRLLAQVRNGVFVRAALLAEILGVPV